MSNEKKEEKGEESGEWKAHVQNWAGQLSRDGLDKTLDGILNQANDQDSPEEARELLYRMIQHLVLVLHALEQEPDSKSKWKEQVDTLEKLQMELNTLDKRFGQELGQPTVQPTVEQLQTERTEFKTALTQASRRLKGSCLDYFLACSRLLFLAHNGYRVDEQGDTEDDSDDPFDGLLEEVEKTQSSSQAA